MKSVNWLQSLLKTDVVPFAVYSSVEAKNIKTGNLYRQYFEEAHLVDTSFGRVACPLKPIYMLGCRICCVHTESSKEPSSWDLNLPGLWQLHLELFYWP